MEMTRLQTTWIPLVLLLLAAGTPGHSAEPDEGQAAAIAAIKKVGGRITFDRNRAVVKVGLDGPKVTDAILVHLKGLTDLKTLSLRLTNVTDAGLMHLKGLTSLTTLYLPGTKVGDAGLEHLNALTKLVNLYLQQTQVTDGGLKHLKGLTKLEFLNLAETKVTDAGRFHLNGCAASIEHQRESQPEDLSPRTFPSTFLQFPRISKQTPAPTGSLL